nr:MAG TPA: hypothetical protein [Caudoviricetes sp.]
MKHLAESFSQQNNRLHYKEQPDLSCSLLLVVPTILLVRLFSYSTHSIDSNCCP